MIFELSWEVANKVGGIYTVLKTKAPYLLNYYGETYTFIGPYLENSKKSFREEKLPYYIDSELINYLEKEGIRLHYGTWLIPGLPKAFLIDFREFFAKKINEIKAMYWDWWKIDSLGSPYDYDEVIAWSTAAGIFLEKLYDKLKFIVHLNEWISGGAALWLKKRRSEIPIVTTFHGIMLSRTLIGNGINIYKEKIENPDELAYKFNIQAKHLTEKVLSNISDVFTTVSEILSKEAELFLGKGADIITPNGIDSKLDPNLEECLLEHKRFKQQVKKFVMSYFFPYYTFDINKSLFMFIASRYEFFGKGIDLFIKSLANLNRLLIKENFDKTIIAFIFVPTSVSKIRESIEKSREIINTIEDIIFERDAFIRNKLLYQTFTGEKVDFDDLLGEEEMIEIERLINSMKLEGNPPLSTHYLNYNEDEDLIIKTLKENGLDNSEKNKVKVIFYPVYLSKEDSLLNLGYKDTIKAMHLGVFPSLYEPFGYTPLETASLAVPSVTSSTAGFGIEVKKLKEKIGERRGIYVINRLAKDDGLEELTNLLYDFSHLSKVERIKNKIAAKNLASLFDWEYFIKEYIKAYNMVLNKNN